jgi:hypothetical protein
MHEVEVRSSAGSRFDCIDATIWQALQVRLNATQVRSNVALHCILLGTCARMQTRNERLQVRERTE